MTENSEPRLPQRFENPRACPVCFGIWLFDTDELGRVHHRHPPKKCVAPTYAEELAPEDDPVVVLAKGSRRNTTPIRKKCDLCGKLFETTKYAQRTCSEKCKQKKIARYRAQYWLTVTKQKTGAAA